MQQDIQIRVETYPSSGYEPAFGLEIFPPHSLYTQHTLARIRNVEKYIGYVPILGGQIIGYHRIKRAIKHKDLYDRKQHVVRGIIECTSLGFLVLIPDLIIRENKKRKQS